MPENSTQNRLSQIEKLADAGLNPAAAQLCRLILEKEPRNIEALVWLARTSPLPDEASKATEQARLLQPDNPAVRNLQTQPQAVAARPVAVAANPYTDSHSFLNYATTVADPPPVAPPSIQAVVIQPLKKPSRIKRTLGLFFGLLFLIGGLATALGWGWQVLDYNIDMTQPSDVVEGQIVQLSSAHLVATLEGRDKQTFDVNEAFFKTITPLVGDSNKKNALVPNAVQFNVTPHGRLLFAEVFSPNKGTALNQNPNYGLLGYGTAPDWAISGVALVFAIIGLLILGRTFGKKKI